MQLTPARAAGDPAVAGGSSAAHRMDRWLAGSWLPAICQPAGRPADAGASAISMAGRGAPSVASPAADRRFVACEEPVSAAPRAMD